METRCSVLWICLINIRRVECFRGIQENCSPQSGLKSLDFWSRSVEELTSQYPGFAFINFAYWGKRGLVLALHNMLYISCIKNCGIPCCCLRSLPFNSDDMVFVWKMLLFSLEATSILDHSGAILYLVLTLSSCSVSVRLSGPLLPSPPCYMLITMSTSVTMQWFFRCDPQMYNQKQIKNASEFASEMDANYRRRIMYIPLFFVMEVNEQIFLFEDE